jgi:hypothetical protein
MPTCQRRFKYGSQQRHISLLWQGPQFEWRMALSSNGGKAHLGIEPTELLELAHDALAHDVHHLEPLDRELSRRGAVGHLRQTHGLARRHAVALRECRSTIAGQGWW